MPTALQRLVDLCERTLQVSNPYVNLSYSADSPMSSSQHSANDQARPSKDYLIEPFKANCFERMKKDRGKALRRDQ